jgi:glycosyltransferase involved in cell wall biosynthesis
MKILFLTNVPPLPVTNGGRIYTWQNLRLLSKGNKITLLALLGEEQKQAPLPEADYFPVCERVFFFKAQASKLSFLLHPLTPFSWLRRQSHDLQIKFDELLNKEKFDLIIVEHWQMWLNLPKQITSKLPVILVAQNLDHQLYYDIARACNQWWRKPLYFFEAWKVKLATKKLAQKKLLSGIIFISDKNAHKFEQVFGRCRHLVIPPLFESVIKAGKTLPVEKHTLLFLGQLDYRPNTQAARLLVKKIMPKILEKIPDAKLYLVGMNPPLDLKAVANKWLVVTGFVSNPEPYFQKAQLVVIPLLGGSGVKIKVFTALLHQKIVVTTAKGVEGTVFRHNKDLLVARDLDELVEFCVANLRRPQTHLGVTGAQTLKQNYQPEPYQKKLAQFLQTVVGKTKNALTN